MRPTKALHELGQSLWLDNVTRDALGVRLQNEGAESFVKSWKDLMACIDSKSAAIRKAS
jgi:hypothetical protein